MYVVCRPLFAVAVQESMAAFGYVMHTDLTPITRPVTWGGFFVDLFVVYAVVAAAAGAGAWLYNRLAAACGTATRQTQALNPVAKEALP